MVIQLGKTVNYTEEELISDLQRCYKEYGRKPKTEDLRKSKGYIPYDQYLKVYKSFDEALIAAGFEPSCKRLYTDEFLISELKRAAYVLGRTPHAHDMCAKNGFPSQAMYTQYFGSLNNALIRAGLRPNRMTLTGNETCTVCGSKSRSSWYIIDGQRICSICVCTPRAHMHGILNINSKTGMGVLAESIVAQVFDNVEMCNHEKFNSQFDLVHNIYGNINVKSSTLVPAPNRNFSRWKFTMYKNSVIPDTYIAIGFNDDKSSIEHVWIIPSNSKIACKSGIFIANTPKGLSRAQQYEVDPTPYNEVYKNLDITTLPEFRNLKTEQSK